ncbi:unnamed protein product [Urochloa humidicola]
MSFHLVVLNVKNNVCDLNLEVPKNGRALYILLQYMTAPQIQLLCVFSLCTQGSKSLSSFYYGILEHQHIYFSFWIVCTQQSLELLFNFVSFHPII